MTELLEFLSLKQILHTSLYGLVKVYEQLVFGTHFIYKLIIFILISWPPGVPALRFQAWQILIGLLLWFEPLGVNTEEMSGSVISDSRIKNFMFRNFGWRQMFYIAFSGNVKDKPEKRIVASPFKVVFYIFIYIDRINI